MALWTPGQALEQSEDLAALMGSVLGWDTQQQIAEANRYRQVVNRDFRPVNI
jgi:hypothetical protein